MSHDQKKTNKLLAEWFWTDRWMGSSAFLLPLEPRGLYREMLTQAWRRGGRLPSDHEAIRRAVGCTGAEWRRCWPQIERYWRLDGGDYVNDTQLDVLTETVAAMERNIERGRKGGRARWGKEPPEPPPDDDAQAMLTHSLSTAQVEPKHMLGACPPEPSPEVSLQKTQRHPRARGAGLMAGSMPIHHGECLVHGPVCMKPPIVRKFLGRFGNDEAKLKAWGNRVSDRWQARVDAGHPIPYGDDFAFWSAAYDEDFRLAATPANAPDTGRVVPSADETAAFLARQRKVGA